MNLRFLKTVVALADHPSLVAASRALHISHSAVSLQIRTLEDELGFAILDRSRRPPSLTDEGHRLVSEARRLLELADGIAMIGRGDALTGRVLIGAVPSTISTVIAPTLAALRRDHPELRIELHSGLSGALLKQVDDGDILAALITDPGVLPPRLAARRIWSEPFDLVQAGTAPAPDLRTALDQRSFIWFDRRSRLSQQVETYLQDRGLSVQAIMEVDSLEAAEALVAHDLGVSILPRRVNGPPNPALVRSPIIDPPLGRHLVVVTRQHLPRRGVVDAFSLALARIAAPG